MCEPWVGSAPYAPTAADAGEGKPPRGTSGPKWQLGAPQREELPLLTTQQRLSSES